VHGQLSAGLSVSTVMDSTLTLTVSLAPRMSEKPLQYSYNHAQP